MYLNDNRLTITDAIATRQPLLQVLTDGNLITGALKASVHNVGHFHADTFEAEFSLDNNGIYDLNWWSSTSPIILDVQIGLMTNGAVTWNSLIKGQVDRVSSHLSTRTLSVSGRDLSARLIDLKIFDAFPNQTSSEIAESLGAQVGLSVNAQATTILVGTYYASDHTELANGQFSRTTTAWDLLTNLAQREGFDIWVSGETLNFQPIAPTDPTPWAVRYTQPTIQGGVSFGTMETTVELSLDRSLTLAKDVVVVVQGWNSSSGKKIKATYPSGRNTSLHQSGSNLQQYVFNVANLKDTSEALTRAQMFYNDIVKNERIIEWREPGDINLTCRNMATLLGTNSSWDVPYFIDTITRDISFDGGFDMTVRAKNQSTQTQTVVG